MNDGSRRAEGGAFPEGVVVPITGLLALLFAVMAGMSLRPALSGPPSHLTFPIAFAVASALCFRLRRRYVAARADEGD
ncbi:hypothetical protein [Halalkalicoccus jeotgali]|uniref:Uncharacterized protein n=1 Tax=Halalkalicoccus jeotgali (strain DSM 18796 / CECT 7217 / JCM 14584 / KCTC 4019 / B3) TaxID=795797 RepID=D8J5E7_HALJB|nr:hypothetical protein [Halalkalicoccus jeotgali]ADJ15643.1 hypothetical protein HacjB3_11300 [Halalkalicoccus jeotgali B3]ELY36587.1 hypothetical protein C497_11348 [Halalkalicoccus jeotgali B3]